MFLLDPDEGLSREELLHKIWHVRCTPTHRARAMDIAAARGCSWLDVLHEIAEEHDAMMADPIQREEWRRTNEEIERRREMPFGPNPLLEQDGAQ